MDSTFYELDPNGDTLLILHNANAPFAVPASSSTTPKAENKSDSTPDSKPTVRMRLSSKHLKLASAYFQKLTAGNWNETTPEVGYSFVVNIHDWDEDALVVLMNIIHGRTAKVPRVVDVEMLAKIAVLVVHYQCHEVVEFFAKTWISYLSISVPKEDERDPVLKLLVCLVFLENLSFRGLTRAIIWSSSGPIDPLGLPIQQDIIGKMLNILYMYTSRRKQLTMSLRHLE